MSRVQQCGIVNHNLMVVRQPKVPITLTIRGNRDNNPGSAL